MPTSWGVGSPARSAPRGRAEVLGRTDRALDPADLPARLAPSVEAGTFALHHSKARFEPSGVANLGRGHVLVVNDKADAARFTVWSDLGRAAHIGAPRPKLAFDLDLDFTKLEDVSASRRNPGWALAITSFEGHPDPSNDRLIQLFVDPASGSNFGRQVPLFDPKSVTRSLKGEAGSYAKVEACAFSPDERQLFVGLRSVGPNHEGQKFGVTLLAYDAKRTGAPPSVVADVDLRPVLGRAEGISALEYAPRLGAWLLTTSYEGDGDHRSDVGGHLWVVPGGLGMLARPEAWKQLPRFRLAHKPEGVTELDDGRVLIVFDDDDDRKDPKHPAKFDLARNEAAFAVLDLQGRR